MLLRTYSIDFGRIGAHIRATLLAPRFQRIEVDFWEFSKNVEIFDIFRHLKVQFSCPQKPSGVSRIPPKTFPDCLVNPVDAFRYLQY